jgi:putative transposase
MPRRARKPADNAIYHVLNRGNCRLKIFHKPADFAAFIKLLEEARRRFGVRILGYILMDNHWHLVLWPRRGADLSRFMFWLTTTHVRRWRAHRGNVGEGHLYQGRFKSFIVQPDEECFLIVMCYVEGNAVRAGMVRRAQDWPWSSLANAPGADGVRVQLTPWPVDRPRDWIARVNTALDKKTLARLHTSLARGRPFGDDQWLTRTVARLGLQATIRNPWRPRKPSPDATTPTKTRRKKREK